jgi:hypothetical protein
MTIELRRLDHDRHRLRISRDAGVEEADLETRSLLVHDLTHYAVEAEAGLDRGFWGLLASGTPMADLSDREKVVPLWDGDLGLAEGLVGPVSGMVLGKTDLPGLVTWFANKAAATGTPTPSWLDAGWFARVEARMRRLLGAWKATPFHGTLVLTWPPGEPVVR